jgi:hypothetical protein
MATGTTLPLITAPAGTAVAEVTVESAVVTAARSAQL